MATKTKETDLNSYSTEDYNRQLAQNNSSSSGTRDTSASGLETTADDYYQLARDQEYSALFDKEIQLENAKANALKYTQNQINANGFGGTGYGSTQQSGIYNNYLNQVSSAQQDYQGAIRDINQTETQDIEDQANDRFESVTTMITQGSNIDDINTMLTDYGYGTTDSGGNFTWGEKPEGMSDDDWTQMKYYYNMQARALAESDATNALNSYSGTYYSSADDLKNATISYNGSTDTLSNHYDKEIDTIQSKVSAGEVPYGSVISVLNSEGQHIYIMYTENGFRMASFDDYEAADNSFNLVRENKQNSWYKNTKRD